MHLDVFDPNISASLVYDGGAVTLPLPLLPEGGMQAVLEKKQFEGTPAEQLVEVSGRTCYDSFGSGRPSAGFHVHLRDVFHSSCHAHFNKTFECNADSVEHAAVLALMWAKMPGAWVTLRHTHLRLTVNLRTMLDIALAASPVEATWLEHYPFGYSMQRQCALAASFVENYAPAVAVDAVWTHAPTPLEDDFLSVWRPAAPLYREEKWVSLFLTMSRGCSHEEVRHAHRGAISQRSTRFCDETETPWIEHPLLTLARLRDGIDHHLIQEAAGSKLCAQNNYALTVDALQPWLVSRGVDKSTARKQARGAARGLLGNALKTEMVKSASVAQWRRQIKQRLTGAADAEIRVLYARILAVLKTCRYADDFADLHTVDSPDGIGEVLA